MPLPSFIVRIYRPPSSESSETPSSGIAATHGDSCVLHVLKYRIIVFSTFATDLVLVALMLVGVLRWKMTGEMGGIWWVLFTQVSIPSFPAVGTVASVIAKLTLAIRAWHGL
jgi:hypothetical protein